MSPRIVLYLCVTLCVMVGSAVFWHVYQDSARRRDSAEAVRVARLERFWELCRASVGDWVKVECGQSVARCVRIERAHGRLNERRAEIVGSALDFCAPKHETKGATP